MKFSKDEISRRETKYVARFDAKNLAEYEDKYPEMVQDIRDLLEVGHTPKTVGSILRRENPQMWPQSKQAESIARAILEQEKE